MQQTTTTTYPKTLQRAAEQRRLGQQNEGVQKAEADAGEEDEAELPTAGLDNGRLAVAEENGHHEDGEAHAEDGDADGDQRIGGVPLHVAELQVEAVGLVRVGPPALAAVQALRLVGHKLVRLAGGADPAALVTGLDDLDLAHAAGFAAHRLGHR